MKKVKPYLNQLKFFMVKTLTLSNEESEALT